MEISHGYHSPQVQRKFLIPLAEKFLVVAADKSSVEEFIEYVIEDRSSSCCHRNVKDWRKDACKALRLVNAQLMFNSQSTPPCSRIISTPTARKRTRASPDDSVVTPNVRTPNNRQTNDLSLPYVPSLRLTHIRLTTPIELQKRLKCFIKSHLDGTKSLYSTWPSILISGPPFCGKTTLLEAVCGSLGAKLFSVSVGTVPHTIRSWMDVFNQAKNNKPCVLHVDDIESMERHSPPVGTFRLTCLLKSRIIKEMIGSGVVLVGETRSLIASLPQTVIDLFSQHITFGMLCEQHRFEILRRFIAEADPTICEAAVALRLGEELTCLELARRTPGYEVGDLVRLVGHLRVMSITLADEGDSDVEEAVVTAEVNLVTPAEVACPDTNVLQTHAVTGTELVNEPSRQCLLPITRAMLDEALSIVIPAVKNTPEFVTIPDVTWADVGGLESTKTQLYNRFMLLVDDWERAQTLRRRSGGVLLEGPPGCGKTLVAKALSNQAGLNFLSVKGPEILNKYQGESERRVREIFERARACQPCLIFFDEIDAICPKRDGDEATGSRVSLVNQLLVELDGVDKHRSGRVFVVGATNRKDMIDPAVLRPGRLGLHLVVNPPTDASERLAVLCACTRDGMQPVVEGGVATLRELSVEPRTLGMSGADLDNLLELAKQRAQLEKQDFVARHNLFDALTELRSGNSDPNLSVH